MVNYFAAAVLMPYAPGFLSAARESALRHRRDRQALSRRAFEQVCHRLTSLRRPGAEGIPLHMLRIDMAGNLSKRFSASGIRFARFSGACPRWNVFQAFMTPGLIRIQLSRMPEGAAYFCIARTIQKDSGGFHAQHAVQAIALGCQVEHAREMVYSDGMDLENLDVAAHGGGDLPALRADRLRPARLPFHPSSASGGRERPCGLTLRARAQTSDRLTPRAVERLSRCWRGTPLLGISFDACGSPSHCRAGRSTSC